MPHIPRQHAPTIGVAPELQAPPREHGPLPEEGKAQEKRAISVASPKLSIFRHTVDPKAVFKALFGKDPEVDDITGIVVPPGKR